MRSKQLYIKKTVEKRAVYSEGKDDFGIDESQ